MALPLERIEGKYEIVAKIRDGGMGALYRVRHRLLDEIRVVKVLRSQLDDTEELRARFAEEARAAIRLRHPNVVQIFDFTLDEDGVGMIVMEHIDGVDLGQLIGSRTVPSLALTLEIARQALRALGYLHRRGFVHRDVSPDNLMLTTDVEGQPLVKIIDLGIAKHGERAQELTSKGVFLGKFRYASPEHFGEGGEAIEPRSDLYAFGLVLYELLTGARPIKGDGASTLIAGHLFRPPQPFSKTDPEGRVPQMLRSAVQRALEKRPDDRFRNAAAFAEIVASVQQHFPLDNHAHHELMTLIRSPSDVPLPPLPGSTQYRLDARFDLSKTPPPGNAPLAAVRDSTADASPASTEDPLDGHLATGCQLAAEGRHAEAIGALRNALDLQPDNTAIRRLLEESLQQRDAKHRRWRDDLQACYAAFEAALEANDLAEAETSLDTASRLAEKAPPRAPSNADATAEEAAEIQARLQAAHKALNAAKTRLEAIVAATEAVQALIVEDRLLEADVALFQATEAYGPSGKLTALRQRLDDVHHGKSEVQVHALIARAEAAANQREFRTALDLMQCATVAATEGPLADTVASVSAGMQDDANAYHRKQAILESERTVLRAIQERNLERAEQVLFAAESRFGKVEPFDALRQILERTACEDRDGDRVNRLIRDAKQHLAAQRFDEAIDKLRQARALAPEDEWIRDRMAAAEASQAQASADRNTATVSGTDVAIDAAVDAVEALRDAGDAMGAWRAVGKAMQDHANAKRLISLRDTLAEEIVEDDQLG